MVLQAKILTRLSLCSQVTDKTSIEARLSGDIFDKTLALPAQTFQTSGGPVSEFTKTGFKLGGSVGNVSGGEYVAWVFRNKNHFRVVYFWSKL